MSEKDEGKKTEKSVAKNQMHYLSFSKEYEDLRHA